MAPPTQTAVYGFTKRILDPDIFPKTEQEEPWRVLIRQLIENKVLPPAAVEAFDDVLRRRAIAPLTERINKRFEQIYKHIGPLSANPTPTPSVGLECIRLADFASLQAAVDALPAAGG